MAVNTGKNSALVVPLPPGDPDENYNCYGANPVPKIETDNSLLFNMKLESFGNKLKKEEGGSRGEERTV